MILFLLIKEHNFLTDKNQESLFACELLRDTPIYLLDEATSALDKNSSTKLEEIILTKKDKTVIMVTHHLRAEIEETVKYFV